jgi:hypothetical protein
MKFWDRFYYFPPENFQEYIYEKTEETSVYLAKRIAEIIEFGNAQGEFKCDCGKAARTYVYLMMGFILSSYYNPHDIDEDIANCVNTFITGIV